MATILDAGSYQNIMHAIMAAFPRILYVQLMSARSATLVV